MKIYDLVRKKVLRNHVKNNFLFLQEMEQGGGEEKTIWLFVQCYLGTSNPDLRSPSPPITNRFSVLSLTLSVLLNNSTDTPSIKIVAGDIYFTYLPIYCYSTSSFLLPFPTQRTSRRWLSRGCIYRY